MPIRSRTGEPSGMCTCGINNRTKQLTLHERPDTQWQCARHCAAWLATRLACIPGAGGGRAAQPSCRSWKQRSHHVSHEKSRSRESSLSYESCAAI
eukprot:1154358-Pelagomonas_calceolata.AAC.2